MGQTIKDCSMKKVAMAYEVKMGQNLVFSFSLPFVIYLIGFDLFSFSKISLTDGLDILSLETP